MPKGNFCLYLTIYQIEKSKFVLLFQKPAMSSTSLLVVVRNFYDEYMKKTPKKLKIVDAYLFYVLLTGIIQFVYCCLVGTFPFNSFLSGFISTVGCFVLGGKYLWLIDVGL